MIQKYLPEALLLKNDLRQKEENHDGFMAVYECVLSEVRTYIESANNKPSSGNAITCNEDRLNRKFILRAKKMSLL